MSRPDFFIVGAQKCGTTSLYRYLREHPRIFMAWVKEPNYFAEDFPRYRDYATRDEYLALFHDRDELHLAAGEASALYLYSAVAAQRIIEFDADARAIVMLRNPIDMLTSIHAQNLWSRFDDEPDLEKAWARQESRAKGKLIPASCPDPKLLQYRDIVSLGNQLERLYGVMDPGRVHTIVFDDWCADVRREYDAVLEFLGVPGDGRSEFPRWNERKQARSRWLQRVIDWRRVPRGVRDVGRKLRLHVPYDALVALNTRRAPRIALAIEFRRHLVDAMRDDVDKLSGLLRRDLSDWSSPGEP